MTGARSKLEVIGQMYARAADDDEDGMVALLAPDFELDVSSYVFNPAVWRGADGAREWLRQAREVWEAPSHVIEGVEELDDERALSAVTLRGIARRSGVAMDIRQWHL